MSIRCLLWDFGDTLCDELSLWRQSAEWMEVYHSFAVEGGLGAAWSLGELDTADVAQHLAKQVSLSESEILAHFRRTDLFDFFPFTYEFFREHHLPQAIVTVNPAIFRDMAESLGMEEVVEAIVISGEEKSADKGVLCQIALERMGSEFPVEDALLIDNKQENLDAWAECGGPGYLDTTDEAFQSDVAAGIEGLIS